MNSECPRKHLSEQTAKHRRGLKVIQDNTNTIKQINKNKKLLNSNDCEDKQKYQTVLKEAF